MTGRRIATATVLGVTAVSLTIVVGASPAAHANVVDRTYSCTTVETLLTKGDT